MIDEKKLIEYLKTSAEESKKEWERFDDHGAFGEYHAFSSVIDYVNSMPKKETPIKPEKVLRHRGGFETERCPTCDTTYQVDRRYTIIDHYCPSCGKLLDGGFKNYCGNCGQAIKIEK